MSTASRQQLFQPLPLTVSGLRTLLSEAMIAALSERFGLFLPEHPPLNFITEYAEQRLPAVFHRESQTRGPAIAALEAAVEQGLEVEEPESGFTWPVDPYWVITETEKILVSLLDVFEATGISVPGSSEFLARKQKRTAYDVFAVTDEDGTQEVRTAFIRDMDATTEYQYALRSSGGRLVLARRERGARSFSVIARLKSPDIPYLKAALDWLHQRKG